jgi:hypothetical protein
VPTFRNLTQQGNASGAALTVTKPTGTVDGDIVVVVAYLETDTNTWSSVGSGFTLLRSDPFTAKYRTDIWWKRASGEPASWTWTPTTTAWRTVTAASYSGNSGTGTAIDISGAGSGTSGVGATTQIAPSVTTTAANDMLLFWFNDFAGDNPTTLTGTAATLRGSTGGQALGDGTVASAGASGTTRVSAGTVTEDWVAQHVALLLTSSGAAASDIPVPLRGIWLNTLIRM